MLVEFTVANFRSIKEPITLSLVASSDKELPENSFPIGGRSKLRLLKSAAIYGPNASGKSNLVKAMEFVRTFVLNSARAGQQGDPIRVTPFKLDPGTADAPSRFEMILARDGTRYVYGFTVDRERVHEEWLTEVVVQPRKLFWRRADGSIAFGAHWRGERNRLQRLVRPNALLLSVAVQLGNETAKPVFESFERLTIIADDLVLDPMGLLTINALANEDGPTGERLVRLMQVADLGISEVSLRSRQPDLITATRGMLQGIFTPGRDDDSPNQGETPKPHATLASGMGLYAVHRNERGHAVSFPFDEESAGTRRLFQLAGPCFMTLDTSGVLVVDELERSLHPLLARYVVGAVNDSATAQLVFTTHNTDLIDPDSKLLRRDQIWMMDKDPSGESRLRSMWDYRIRKDENLRRGYLEGRYGATPIIGGRDPWRGDA